LDRRKDGLGEAGIAPFFLLDVHAGEARLEPAVHLRHVEAGLHRHQVDVVRLDDHLVIGRLQGDFLERHVGGGPKEVDPHVRDVRDQRQAVPAVRVRPGHRGRPRRRRPERGIDEAQRRVEQAQEPLGQRPLDHAGNHRIFDIDRAIEPPGVRLARPALLLLLQLGAQLLGLRIVDVAVDLGEICRSAEHHDVRAEDHR
jgi:hypothetical protein